VQRQRRRELHAGNLIFRQFNNDNLQKIRHISSVINADDQQQLGPEKKDS
jgi:hypothetical protein